MFICRLIVEEEPDGNKPILLLAE